MTYDEALAEHRRLADLRAPLVLRQFQPGAAPLTEAETAELAELERRLEEVETRMVGAPSAALARLHARVGTALDEVDPEAVLRERAEER